MTLPRLAVTMGDPAGVGPELCLRMLQDRQVREACVPVVFGDARILRQLADRLGISPPEFTLGEDSSPDDLARIETAAVYDFAVPGLTSIQPGQVSAATGNAAYLYIDRAIRAALDGTVAGVVTGPIHKGALQAAGFDYPGHTEIFAKRTNAERYAMMLTAPEITCSLVTTHVGYRDVPRLLTTESILDVTRLTAEAMRRIRRRTPRLAVCGLNPHAGEEGLFGDREEQRIIMPAVRAACGEGLQVIGPLPPDTAFLPERRSKVDAYICMYHDQGLVPLKTLAFDRAVNVTLGLPIVRTSVDHGTALDIAWQGKADPGSMIQAVLLAVKLGSQTP